MIVVDTVQIQLAGKLNLILNEILQFLKLRFCCQRGCTSIKQLQKVLDCSEVDVGQNERHVLITEVNTCKEIENILIPV